MKVVNNESHNNYNKGISVFDSTPVMELFMNVQLPLSQQQDNMLRCGSKKIQKIKHVLYKWDSF